MDQPLGNFWLLPSPSSGLCIPQPPAKLPCPCCQPSPHRLLTGQDQESQEDSNKEQPGPHGALVPAERGPVSPSSSPHPHHLPQPGVPPWGDAVALKQGLGRVRSGGERANMGEVMGFQRGDWGTQGRESRGKHEAGNPQTRNQDTRILARFLPLTS